MNKNIAKFDKSALGRPAATQPSTSRRRAGAKSAQADGWKTITLDIEKFEHLLKDALPGEVFAWSSGDEGPRVRRSGGVATQEKNLWRATGQGIDLYTLARPLEDRGGKFAPAGKWRVAEKQTLRFETPRVRVGKVASDVTKGDNATGGTFSTKPTSVDLAISSGMKALAYLPATVRAGVHKAIPSPVRASGHLYATTRDGHTVGLDLSVMFLGEKDICVIRGRKNITPGASLDAAPWTLNQLVANISSQTANLTSSPKRHRISAR